MSVGTKLSRRCLLRHAWGAAAAGITLPHFVSFQRPTAPPTGISAKSPTGTSANDQIGVGIIGCGRRNGQLAIGKGGQGAPPKYARIVAVADLNARRADAWSKYYKCPAYQDYRDHDRGEDGGPRQKGEGEQGHPEGFLGGVRFSLENRGVRPVKKSFGIPPDNHST